MKMVGKKRKVISDPEKIVEYRRKLRRPLQPFLSNKERQKFTLKSPYSQRFSLSSNILQYVAKNPLSPNAHLKFISTCKFLARMSRILPIEKLAHYDIFDDIYKWEADEEESINLKSNYFKFWLFGELCISTNSFSNLASIFIKQMYKFKLREMFIQNQDLTFEELQILVSGGHLENVEFLENVIKNGDGSITEFEKVFELLCCKKLTISFPDKHHGIGKNTTYKIIGILSSDQVPKKLRIFLRNVPHEFDFPLFSKFLAANINRKQHSIEMFFSD